ncbi:hypothetical protein LO762_30100 [Actinocorallia sp. API 0066]|uniref:hypothetical protein n=1 Tax=Actinocorallia sp. API 0066 TaxID=2896846 RepID=UPI001E2F90E7|nr:hypothetical protein [Actinocorallia sp. API 0066]MCD0453402.1 hypothetical protein [Actinocorallia sp. API 0066]
MTTDLETGTPLKRFADFLRTQPETAGLTDADVAAATTRQELGIGSLAIILLVNNYIVAHAPGVMIKPEWVSRLNDIEGILAVLAEIDASAA